MDAEIKTDYDVKELPQFEFKTDLPMRSLFFDDAVKETDSRVVEVKQNDARASDGRKRVRLTASSDATDLVGDVMSKNALNQMKNAAAGTTIFLNHDATVPESVFGSVEQAELVTRIFKVFDEKGKETNVNVLCLEYDVLVEETSDRAVKVWNMIDGGITKLGASVTIAIVEKSPMAGGRRQIDDVVYLETSIVGIPCNQTAWVRYVKNYSWVEQAKKSLRSINKKSPVTANAGPVEVKAQPETKSEEIKMDTSMTAAKNAAEAVKAFKDLFTECVEDHFENPWLYMYLLEDCMVDLIYFNSQMPVDEKLAAAGEMFDAFKAKELEILALYWAETEDESKAAFVKNFNTAAVKHLQTSMKAGNRNNQQDQKTLDTMHDLCVQLGAECNTEKNLDATETETKMADETKTTETAEVVKTEAKGEEVAPPVDALTVEVKVLDMPEVQALVKEWEEKLATLTTETEAKAAQFTEQIAEKDAEIEKLTADVIEWKAIASTATAMLEATQNAPAPRSDASVN